MSKEIDHLLSLVKSKLAATKPTDEPTVETSLSVDSEGVVHEGTVYEVKTASHTKISKVLMDNTVELAKKVASQIPDKADLFLSAVDAVFLNKAAGIMGNEEVPLDTPEQVIAVAADMVDSITANNGNEG